MYESYQEEELPNENYEEEMIEEFEFKKEGF